MEQAVISNRHTMLLLPGKCLGVSYHFVRPVQVQNVLGKQREGLNDWLGGGRERQAAKIHTIPTH